MVRPEGIVAVVIVVRANSRNRVVCTSRIAGAAKGRRRSIGSPWNRLARTLVVSSNRGQHVGAAVLVREAKLALPFQQSRAAAAVIQATEKPHGPSGNARFWFFRFVRACL